MATPHVTGVVALYLERHPVSAAVFVSHASVLMQCLLYPRSTPLTPEGFLVTCGGVSEPDPVPHLLPSPQGASPAEVRQKLNSAAIPDAISDDPDGWGT